jgi:hypothetical protein
MCAGKVPGPETNIRKSCNKPLVKPKKTMYLLSLFIFMFFLLGLVQTPKFGSLETQQPDQNKDMREH